MKRLTYLRTTVALAMLFIGYANSWAQNEVAMPGSFHQHGKNSSDVVTATENTDSVTVTAVMQYWVQPDPAVANPLNTYVWTLLPGAALGAQTAGSPTNLATITFGAVPTAGTISVVETAATGTCPGSTTTINVQTINKPTVTGGAAPAAQCSADPSTVTFAVPLTLTSDLALGGVANQVRVNYTVLNPDATTLLAATNIDLDKNTGTFNVTLTGAVQYGNYTVTINSVSDRISRKSNVLGIVNTPNITLTVNRIPVTGPIFHVPNN